MVGAINGTTHVQSEKRQESGVGFWYEPAKRLLDLLISSVLLAVAACFLIPVSIAILIDSPGPVFYRRRVVGRDGRAFHALKLRTMIEDGDAKVEHDSGLAEEYENNHKLRRDPRVTRLGRMLRRMSIDELPQLVNVFRGEMSLVGPRMISFPELKKFGRWQDKILQVKPGITGLWQVNGRSDLNYEDRVRLNVYYVDHRSLLLDLKILAKTVPVVLTGRGAY